MFKINRGTCFKVGRAHSLDPKESLSSDPLIGRVGCRIQLQLVGRKLQVAIQTRHAKETHVPIVETDWGAAVAVFRQQVCQ